MQTRHRTTFGNHRGSRGKISTFIRQDNFHRLFFAGSQQEIDQRLLRDHFFNGLSNVFVYMDIKGLACGAVGKQ